MPISAKAVDREPSGTSMVHMALEKILVGKLASRLSEETGKAIALNSSILKPTKPNASDGAWQVEVDGYYREGNDVILAEAFARSQKPLSGQKRKILADVLKLAFLKLEYPENFNVRVFIIVPDKEAIKWMNGEVVSAGSEVEAVPVPASWAQLAAKRFKVEIEIAPLLPADKAALKVAKDKLSADAKPAVKAAAKPVVNTSGNIPT